MIEPTETKQSEYGTPRAKERFSARPEKKKGLLEWIMLAIGLSYGDEGEDKWARRRDAAAASDEKPPSGNQPRP